MSGYLVDWHRGVMIVLLFYGFLYTPIISYVTARLEGMVGQAVDVPMVREAGYILSGYRGINIWFIPLPLNELRAEDRFLSPVRTGRFANSARSGRRM